MTGGVTITTVWMRKKDHVARQKAREFNNKGHFYNLFSQELAQDPTKTILIPSEDSASNDLRTYDQSPPLRSPPSQYHLDKDTVSNIGTLEGHTQAYPDHGNASVEGLSHFPQISLVSLIFTFSPDFLSSFSSDYVFFFISLAYISPVYYHKVLH